MSKSVECGRVVADVYYDDQDKNNKGWYASYTRGDRVLTDSMKIDHPDMPRRKDAEKKALRIAKSVACKLNRQR